MVKKFYLNSQKGRIRKGELVVQMHRDDVISVKTAFEVLYLNLLLDSTPK